MKGKQTIFCEGARGSLTQRLFKQFGLTKDVVNQQQYGIGLKEIWEVDNDYFEPGLASHTVNWPLPSENYGGSFMYHMNKNQIHIGFVVGLDYKNPYLNPYEEF